jgi:hypothetical protein
VQQFCHTFAERAFRRPLSEDERALFVDQRFSDTSDLDGAVRKVVLFVLKSPRFLFLEIGSPDLDGYSIASRLSFALWDSIPDQLLWDAAASGQLETADQIAGRAARMVEDPRVTEKMRCFLHQWLRMNHLQELSKDDRFYPEFNEMVASDLRTSLELQLDEVLMSPSCDFRQLLLADWLYLNGRLAPLFGVDLPVNADFQRVSLGPHERAGVLSHPFLLAGFAYRSRSSPIHRGVFIARNVLGRSLKPPPEAVVPLPENLHPDLTTRERVILQTKTESCQACHGMINPLGFSLEHYDTLGRYRTEERGRSVDSRGSYRTLKGEVAEFSGVREMAEFLASSEETHSAFIEQLFHYLVKQPVAAYGADRLDELRQSFAATDFQIKKLMVKMVTTSALASRSATGAAR